MNYKNKYLKYKSKYLKLKINNLTGGNIININNSIMSNDKNIGEIISWTNDQEYFDEDINENIGWTIEKLDDYEFEQNNIRAIIKLNWLHLNNIHIEENSKPLFILPGFSNSSLGMTLKRINQYHQDIFNHGFSDIYIFDFTSIGKYNENTDLQKIIKDNLGEEEIAEMYRIISSHIKTILEDYNNISILGRSAGGGLSLNLVFTHDLYVNGLNIACPGINIPQITDNINNYNNKDLPIKLVWSEDDTKIPINDGYELSNIFNENNYSNFEFIEVNFNGDNNDKLNHRIQPELINNLA